MFITVADLEGGAGRAPSPAFFGQNLSLFNVKLGPKVGEEEF